MGEDGKHCRDWRRTGASGSVGFRDDSSFILGFKDALPSSWGSGLLSWHLLKQEGCCVVPEHPGYLQFPVNYLYTQPSSGEGFPSQGEASGKVRKVFSLGTEL